jgi:hypothetical protein
MTLSARTGSFGGHDATWKPRERFTAACARGGNHKPPPVAGCTCGIYAARDRDHLAEQSYQELDSEDDAIAFGTVSLWGRVMVCERGWRAQYAYPQRLFLPFSFARHAAELEDAYGVPVAFANPFALKEH